MVRQACAELKVEFTPVRITSYFKHFGIGDSHAILTLHFSKDYVSHIRPPELVDNVVVDSMEDITANKICAALGRNEIKDLVDLYFLDKANYKLPDYFEDARQKDAGLSWETLVLVENAARRFL